MLAGQLAATLRQVTESRPNSRRDPANGRLTKSRQRSVGADLRRSWREGIAGTTPAKCARDSAHVQAHSTDVRRACHALTHFLLCRTRRGKVGLWDWPWMARA